MNEMKLIYHDHHDQPINKNSEEKWKKRFPIHSGVNTPLGPGVVVAYVKRIIFEVVVSLDHVPQDTFDLIGVVISLHSFRPGVLEVLKNEK